MNEKEYIFRILEQMADAIVNTFGRGCEVAVHDLSNLQKSLVYIAGEVTKRKIGAPITDLVVKVLHQEGREIKDIFNYKTTTSEGKVLKSTTAFIRNSSGKVIGAFCINFDTTDFSNACHALDAFINTIDFGDYGKAETFASTISETIGALVEQAVSEIGKQPSTMSKAERIKFVGALERQGTFQIKGAVDQVAIMLGVSKYTVYNYLQKIRAHRVINKV